MKMAKEFEVIKDNHIGSMSCIILGVLFVLSSLVALPERGTFGSNFVGGLSLFFGALAFRMAKKRMLGVQESSIFRLAIEISCIVLAIAVVIFRNDLAYHAMMNPVGHVVIPFLVVISYGFLLVQK